LSRDEPNPGGKITPRSESTRVGDSGGNSARANDTDPMDALQSLARLICTMPPCLVGMEACATG